jgi:uncharacterized protein (TIGR03382 family)
MTSFSHRAPWVGALLAGGAMAFAPHSAGAQECSTASDCSEGYRCERYTYESCNGWACEAGDPRCPDPVPAPTCYEDEYTTCVQAPCVTDSDCPARMACHAQSYYVCDGGMAGAGGSAAPCAPGEMCAPPDPVLPPTCWEEAGDSLCTPRHQLPCMAASDCGGGFDCIEATYWVCSGSGVAGTGAAGSGAADPGMPLPPDTTPMPGPRPDPSECHEERSGTFYCQLQDLPCSADTDCPDGLQCRDNYVYPPCVGPVAGAGGDGMADGEWVCPEPTVQQRCMPPEYYGGGRPVPGGPGMMGGVGGSPAGGGSEDADDPGTPIGNPAPGVGMGTGTAGTGAAGAGGATSDRDDETAAPPTGDGNANGGDGNANGGDGDDNGGGGGVFGWLTGGCSASGPIKADPLSWLAFGLVALVLRRRARSAA